MTAINLWLRNTAMVDISYISQDRPGHVEVAKQFRNPQWLKQDLFLLVRQAHICLSGALFPTGLPGESGWRSSYPWDVLPVIMAQESSHGLSLLKLPPGSGTHQLRSNVTGRSVDTLNCKEAEKHSPTMCLAGEQQSWISSMNTTTFSYMSSQP